MGEEGMKRRIHHSAAGEMCGNLVVSGQWSAQLGSRESLPRAFLAKDAIGSLRITPVIQLDDHTTAVAVRRLVRRWILQFYKVVFVRPIPDIDFRFKRFAAFLAGSPVACVLLAMMERTERVATVVPVATVPRV